MITHKLWDKVSPINNIVADEVLQRRPELANLKDVLLFMDADENVINIEDPAIIKYNLNIVSDDVEEIALQYELFLNEQASNFSKKQLSTNDFTNEHFEKLNGLTNYVHPDNADTRHVTDIEKEYWNSKSDFDGTYPSLTQKPLIPTKLSQLTNDANFTTPSGHNHHNLYYPIADVDTKLSKKTDKTYVDLELSKKADKATTYSKTEIDAKVGKKADSADVYTILQVDEKLDAKANSENVYSKEAMDTELYKKTDKTYTDIELGKKANADEVYTILQLNPVLEGKANKDSVYSKLEVDAKFDTTVTTEVLDTKLAKKADKTTTYTKADVDSKLSTKANLAYTDIELAKKADKETTYTKGDIDVEMGKRTTKVYVDSELAKKANSADVYTNTELDISLGRKADKETTYTKLETDAELAKKANKTDVPTKLELANALALKSDKAYVDTQLGEKANKIDVYTKAEVNGIMEAKADKLYVDSALTKKADVTSVYTKTEIGALDGLLTTNKTSFVSAINEVFQSASNGKNLISTAITGMGVGASPTDTFGQLVEKLDTIEVGIKVNNAIDSVVTYGEYLSEGDLFVTDGVGNYNPELSFPSIMIKKDPKCCCYSNSGTYLAIVISSSVPYLYMYKRLDVGVYTSLGEISFPSSLTTCSCAFSPDDNYFIVVGTTSPFFALYKREGDVFTQMPQDSISQGVPTYSVAFSPDGAYLALSARVRDCARLFRKLDTTWEPVYIENSNTNTSSTTSYGCAFSPDGNYLVYTSSQGNSVHIYAKQEDGFAKLSTDVSHSSLPRKCIFSPNGEYLFVTLTYSPYIVIYHFVNGVLEKLDIPELTVSSMINDISFLNDGSKVAIGCENPPYLFIYSLIYTS